MGVANMDEQVQTLQRLIDESNFTLVITGAGISVASGIPSMHGLNLAETLQFACRFVYKSAIHRDDMSLVPPKGRLYFSPI